MQLARAYTRPGWTHPANGAIAGVLGAMGALAISATLAAPPAQANVTSDPVRLAREDIQASCLKVEYPDDFVQRVDLTGDDRLDIIITYNVVCDGFHSLFCSRDGCVGSVFVARPDGAYEQVELPPTIAPTTWNNLPAVRIPRPRRECVGGGPCERLRVWDGRAFVPPSASLAQLAAEAGSDDAAATEEAPAELATTARVIAGLTPATELGAPEPVEDAETETAATETQEPAALGALPPEIEAIVALGPQRESWFLSKVLRLGKLSAARLGPDGRSSLTLSCAPGDAQLEISVTPSETAALGAVDRDGAERDLDIQVGRRVVDRVRLRFAADGGDWRGGVEPRGVLIRALQRGVTAAVQDQEAALVYGQFDLTNSRRMINALRAACGV